MVRTVSSSLDEEVSRLLQSYYSVSQSKSTCGLTMLSTASRRARSVVCSTFVPRLFQLMIRQMDFAFNQLARCHILQTERESEREGAGTAIGLLSTPYLTGSHIAVLSSAKQRALGCVIERPRREGEFTQPRAHSFADLCRFSRGCHSETSNMTLVMSVYLVYALI